MQTHLNAPRRITDALVKFALILCNLPHQHVYLINETQDIYQLLILRVFHSLYYQEHYIHINTITELIFIYWSLEMCVD